MTLSPLQDYAIAGTPFRGLILRGEFCLLAYIGVPEGHWLANLEELEFDCHYGVTFRGAGDGVTRPQGWYWYGWDYAHAFDVWELNGTMKEALELLPPDVQALWQDVQQRKGGRRWTVADVQVDLTESALELLAALQAAEDAAKAATQASLQPPSR